MAVCFLDRELSQVTDKHEQGSNGVRPHKNVDGYNIECNVESEFVCKMAHDAKDTQKVKRDNV
jgi:hypothetical protein